MAKKRGNNEGSVFKRKDGRWCAQVSLSGRRITQYAKSQRECFDWVREITNKIERGMTFDATQLTLERYMQSWLAGKDLPIRPNTARNYRRYAEQHILPVMGKMRLQNIQPAHIRQLYLLLDIGTPVNTVQSRAGHSKASATTDIYGHAMAHSQDAAAENIEEIVTPLTNDLQQG